jgi:uncharacterized RDD family membrane protein YckC
VPGDSGVPAASGWEERARSLGNTPPPPGQTAAAADPLVGKTLHHFKVLARIGQGGMGRVYKAHDLSLDRPVALKVIAESESGDDAQRRRFVREARAQARLNHPNVVQIYYIGEADAQLFFAMELVDGEPLDAPLARGEKLAWKEALNIAIDVADVLKSAHARGFVHRDIKPSNLLRDGSGRVKVADFGLAKSLHGSKKREKRLTQKGDVLGSPLYMSPEQAAGEEVDLRADIYALGATLYHLVTGAPAFDGNSALAVISQHLTKPPPRLRSVLPEAPERLEKLILKMMAKKPADRFADYDELLYALRAACPSAFTPAGFVVRAMAFSIDWVVGGLAIYLLDAWGWVVFAPYLFLSWWRTGKSAGKWVFRLKVCREDKQPLGLLQSVWRCVLLNWGILCGAAIFGLHYLVFGDTSMEPDKVVGVGGKIVVSLLLLGFAAVVLAYLVGFLWVGIRSHKRAWHDLAAKTMVIYDVAEQTEKRPTRSP